MKQALYISVWFALLFSFQAPLRGQTPEHRTLVIPVEFKDLSFTFPPERIDSLLLRLSEYYNTQFLGTKTFIFDRMQVRTLAEPYAYYGANDVNGSFDIDYRSKYLPEAILRICDADTDFSVYDNDGNGNVNDIIIIVPGVPESESSGPDFFRPRYIPLNYSLAADKKRISGFAIVTELSTAGDFAGIGIIAHEFGHILGLKDMYDTDGDASEGVCPGLGITSLMDIGMGNDGGNTPPNLNAVEREMLGTGFCEVLDTLGTYSLEPIHLAGHFCMLQSTQDAGYFLLENRSTEGRDAFIGGGGLLVYKVNRSSDPAGYSTYFRRTLTALERWRENQVNCNPAYPCAEIRLYWPQDAVQNFNADGKVLTCISKDADGAISFKLVQPIRMDGVSVFQNSAILAWTVSEDIAAVDSCKLEWSAHGKILGREDGTDNGDGRRSITLKGLSPYTEYNYTASVYYSDGSDFSVSGKFTTRIFRNGIFRFIYFSDDVRNADGSFKAGCRIPLVVYNSVDEHIEWTFNDLGISAGPDGKWAVPGSGTLKAEVTNEDGSKDIIIKEITVR